MSYILPLVINNRRLSYTDLRQQPRPGEMNDFVIELPELSIPFTIFELDMSRLIQSVQKDSADIALRNCNFGALFNEESFSLDVMISTGTGQAPPPVQVKNVPNEEYEDYELSAAKPKARQAAPPPMPSATIASIEVNDVYKFGLRLAGGKLVLDGELPAGLPAEPVKEDRLLCRIILEADGVKYAATLNFYLSHPSIYLHCGLDFGSEASQLTARVFRKNAGSYKPVVTTPNLFQLVKNMEAQGDQENSSFLQYEKDSNFFRSIFFLQKKLSDFTPRYEHELFLPGENKNLKFLTREANLNETTNNYYQLPNLKLSHKHGSLLNFLNFSYEHNGQTYSIGLEDLKDKTYTCILKNFIRSWLREKIAAAFNHERFFLRVTLLVPNIYGVDDVANSRYSINAILASLNEEPDFFNRLKGWELSTLSESDASYLGFFGRTASERNKYYIIIDCGKGTTDFSVIQTGQDNNAEVKPLYRNGFAGAGNLLSYAVMETIFGRLISLSNNQALARQFVRRVLSQPKHSLYRFYQHIERLKINYRASASQKSVEQAWENAVDSAFTFANIATDPDANIDNLNRLLGQITELYDWDGYIQDTCNGMVENIVSNIQVVLKNKKDDAACGGILLTGRGFLFAPLREKLAAALGRMPGISPDMVRSPQSPFEYKSICLNGIFDNSFITNPELVGFPILVSTDKAPDPAPAAAQPAAKAKTGLMNQLVRLLGTAESKPLFREGQNSYSLGQTDFSRDRFLIGNRLYKVSNPQFSSVQQAQQSDLVFTRSGYLVRLLGPDGRVTHLSELAPTHEMDMDTYKYIIPSLFPAHIDNDYVDALSRDFTKSIPPPLPKPVAPPVQMAEPAPANPAPAATGSQPATTPAAPAVIQPPPVKQEAPKPVVQTPQPPKPPTDYFDAFMPKDI